MPKVEIYSKDYCPYCRGAKALLKQLGWNYTEYDLQKQPRRVQEMKRRSGRHTVPQIFIDNRHIGGFDDFSAMIAQHQN